MNRSNSKNSKTNGLEIKKASKKSSAKAPPKKFPIVGIGASAGGMEAFTSLLEALPIDTGMAFVFVQHLAPTHESLGPEILSRSTRMEVRQVEEGMRVKPNCVYLIPPNHGMILSNCVLTLEPRTLTRGQHLTIDTFFQSLAADQRGRAVGVVLSGAASDGTQGLRAIKGEGGLCIAQEPTTAKHGDMPKSAIAAGVVDLILPPAEIARELARIAKHPYIAAACESGSETQTESDALIQDNSEDETPPDAALRKIFALLRIYSKIDFSHYKHTTLKRRIQRRMIVRRTDTLEAYAQYLREDNDEVKSLFNDILINLTEFFRDPESHKALVEQVFPQLINKRSIESPIRIWVAACATGEEAYSLAISLVEFLGESGAKFPIQIFATDISEPCLQKARAGIYSESNLRGVSKERLKRFFDKVEGGYKINKAIRPLVLFSRHDLGADPAFGKLDLISCRNLLIYFAVVLQKRVIPVFHYALKSGGFLWLGKSESTGTLASLFTVLDKTHKLYSKANVQTPMTFRFPASAYVPEVPVTASQAPVRGRGTPDFHRIADRIALSKYAPPSVVVNCDLEILQFRGETGSYLQIPPGAPSSNLFKLVRPDLLHTLRMTIHEARAQNKPARHEALALDLNGKRRKVGIQVIPVNPHEQPNQRNLLVFFEEPATTSDLSKKKSGKHGAKADSKNKVRSEKDRVTQLEQEASANKLYQQAMFEDFEANREDLAAGNEELQSTNEELQSTNEELETAKEEVQSSNEELTTVNDELQARNAELTVLTSDLNNILASVDIPLVIVDAQHRIRRFTPQAGKVFNFIESDVGRPLVDIRATFDWDLDGLVSEVIESLVTLEREVQDSKGHWMRLQIRPFKTIDNKIDGAVIAFVDIDALKTSLDTAQSQRDRFRRIAALSGIGLSYGDYPLYDLNWDEKTKEHFWLPASAHPVTLDTFYERVHPEDRERTRKATEEAAESRSLCDIEFRSISPGNESEVKWIRALCWTDYSPSGTPVRTDGVTLDITEQKRMFQRLEDEKKKLETIFVDSPANMTLLRGPTFIFEKVNPSYQALVGGRDVMGKALLDALPEVDMQPFFNLMKEVFETGIPHSAKEVAARVIRTPGGKPQDTYFDHKYTRVNDSQGKPYGVYVYSVDITEKVMARKQIEQLAKSLSESVRARDEFMSIASHELKTPITGMKIQTQMFKRAVKNNSPHAYDPARVTEVIHAIDYGLDQMTRLIDDMLDISKIQLGKLAVQCEPTDITKLVAEITDRLRPEFAAAGITVHTKLTEELRCDLDRFRFEQVLTNLATNAIRYAPHAPVEVELKREATHVVLRFRDHGPGVPKADHERVFKRFERLVSADKTSGLGLGLYICREIAEAHGGSIRIDAETSPGACFVIRLPIEMGACQ